MPPISMPATHAIQLEIGPRLLHLDSTASTPDRAISAPPLSSHLSELPAIDIPDLVQVSVTFDMRL